MRGDVVVADGFDVFVAACSGLLALIRCCRSLIDCGWHLFSSILRVFTRFVIIIASCSSDREPHLAVQLFLVLELH